MYVDRHLKLVETGGLGLAIAALSSKDYRYKKLVATGGLGLAIAALSSKDYR